MQTIDQKQIDSPVKIVLKHYLFVRLAHWTNIPTLLGLILSGLSIYWASPVIKISTADGNKDTFEIIGALAIKFLPGQTDSARNWFYNHFALGSGNLAYALNIHWLCTYLLMAVSVIYAIGSVRSGSYRSLLPRPTDIFEGFKMVIYYLKVVPSFVLREPNPHPIMMTKYNTLQRFAYFSVSIATLLSILTGWAIHKPAQLGTLQALFGGYDSARFWHFLLMFFYGAFVVPHVVLVVVEGFDCFRSMVVGWSKRIE